MQNQIILSREDAEQIICTVADSYYFYKTKVEKVLASEFPEFEDSGDYTTVIQKLPLAQIERLLLFLSN